MPKPILPSRYAGAVSAASSPATSSSEAAASDSTITRSAKWAATVTPEDLVEQHPLKRQKLVTSGLSNTAQRGPAATLPPGRSASPIKVEAAAVLARTQHHERLRKLTPNDLQAAALVLRGNSRAGNNCVTLTLGILEFLRTGVMPNRADSRSNTPHDFAVKVMVGLQHQAIKKEPDAPGNNGSDGDDGVLGDSDHEQPDQIMTSTIVHHSQRLSAFIPPDPVDSLEVGPNTIQMLEQIVYDVDRYSQPFMQFDQVPDILRQLALHCALANHGNGSPATYGIINLGAANAELVGHQIAYFARSNEVMFIDCQSIVNGTGTAVASTLDALFNFGQTGTPAEFQSKIFVTPSYPFVAAQVLREQLSNSGVRVGARAESDDVPVQPVAMSALPGIAASHVNQPRKPSPQPPVMTPAINSATNSAVNPVVQSAVSSVSTNTEHMPVPVPVVPAIGSSNKQKATPKAAWSLSSAQKRKIIQKSQNKNAIEEVERYAPALMVLPPLGLGMSGEDIVKIAANHGGSKSLDAVGKHAPALQALGMALGDIVKIAANIGGSKALEAVGEHAHALQALGMALGDIVKIAANNGGSNALEAVGEHAPALQALGMALGDIVKIAANNGGSKALEAVGKHVPALQALGMALGDIVKIAANGGGSKTLEAVGKHAPALQTLGMAPGDIVKIAANDGGSKALEAVGEHAPALQALGMALGDIVKIAANGGGSKALEAVGEHAPALQALGMALGDIVKIAANNGGSKALEAVGKHAPALQALGLALGDIVKIAANIGGSKALEAVGKHAPALKALGMALGDIVKIAANDGGSKALEAVGEHAPALQALGMAVGDIVKIAANNGGSKALEAVGKHAPALQALGMALGDIVKIAANGGGSKALEAVGEHAPALQALGLAVGDIVKIASYPGATSTLRVIADGKWQQSLSKEQLLKIACKNSASKKLEKL